MAASIDIWEMKRELEMHLEKPLAKGDTWCLIEKQWLERCKKYLNLPRLGTSTKDKYSPGPIDNKALFKDDNSGEICDDMFDDDHFKLLPEEGWNMLVQHFGVKEGQQTIARKVVEHGIFIKYRKVEVYFVGLKLAENSNLESVVMKQFSKGDTLEHIDTVMREEFNIEERVETRLWIKYSSKTYQQVEMLENTVEFESLFNGQLIIIEQRNEDGTWPRTWATDLEERRSSIKKMTEKEINNVKEGVKNQYLIKIEEINRKIEDEEKSIDTLNAKRKLVETEQMHEKNTLEKKHKGEKTVMEKKHKDEKLAMEKKHKVELKKARKTYENDGVYLASLKEARNELGRDVDNMDMDLANDHKNLEDARKELECPVCLEEMKPPMKIWMCSLSHIICELCKNKLEGRLCPSCRTNQVAQRAIVVENLARCAFNK